jgi:sigma-54 specific flagellar transcriptional regulator A
MKPSTQFIGQSDSAQSLRDLLSTIANSNSTVLITGESGTGKELLARSLHEQSMRAGSNFVPINCAAIPKELLESELFGHRRGSFTGAVSDRLGRFELAHGGTLFLDEIGDMPMDMQVKLLRVLQERTIDPIGSTRQIPVDVRVIAATHRDLDHEITTGKFREDLYYRLNVLPVNTPPLRERVEDVEPLLLHFAQKFAHVQHGPIRFSAEFLASMREYAWPGNVRELSNLVDRFSTLYAGQRLDLRAIPPSLLPKGMVLLQAQLKTNIQAPVVLQSLTQPQEVLEENLQGELPLETDFEDLLGLAQGTGPSFEVDSSAGKKSFGTHVAPTSLALADGPLAQGVDPWKSMADLPMEGLSLKDRMAEIEKSLIKEALSRTQGNVSKTAKMLNLQRTTLIEKINKYDLRSA